MNPERWRQVEQLYHAALEKSAGQRPGFLDQACAGDEALGREVESLLAQNDTGDGFLEAPAMEVAVEELARERGYFEPYALALTCVALGRTEAALDWLDRAEETRSSWLTVHAALDSRLDPLRGHPRFHKLMVRMGLTA